MGNQMVTSEIRKLLEFDKTQVKLFPNFTSIPFGYLLISWVTNYAHNPGLRKRFHSNFIISHVKL